MTEAPGRRAAQRLSDAVWARVFELAERGRYSTSPNPRVGAVVLDADGAVAGEGFHERAGGPHAEVEALRTAGDRARGGTLFVNLEPCAHHGRTPPCADAVIGAGLRRVAFSLRDPDPRTAGLGAERLREAGMEVEIGAYEGEAERLNEPFLAAVRNGRPYVHLKWAATLDGKTATRTGDSMWITGEDSRRDALRLREEHDAILVGAGTVLADDPLLTRRLGLASAIVPHRRVVVDGRLRVSSEAKLFRSPEGGEVWLATGVASSDARLCAFRERGVHVVAPEEMSDTADLRALLEELRRVDVRSLLVEGGGATAWSFLEAGLVDRVTAYVAPLLVGGAGAPGGITGGGIAELRNAVKLAELEVDALGADVRISGKVKG